MKNAQVKEVSEYIAYQVKYRGGESSSTPLNPHYKEKLESKLFEKAVKALRRYDPSKAPLVPFLKMILDKEAKREAARLFNKQCKRGEHSSGDLSLDAMVSPEEGETFVDLLGESDEVVRCRRIRRDVQEVLLHLSIRENMALESLMFADISKEMTAKLLGVTRPTLDRFIREEAIPHFVKIWNESGKKLR